MESDLTDEERLELIVHYCETILTRGFDEHQSFEEDGDVVDPATYDTYCSVRMVLACAEGTREDIDRQDCPYCGDNHSTEEGQQGTIIIPPGCPEEIVEAAERVTCPYCPVNVTVSFVFGRWQSEVHHNKLTCRARLAVGYTDG